MSFFMPWHPQACGQQFLFKSAAPVLGRSLKRLKWLSRLLERIAAAGTAAARTTTAANVAATGTLAARTAAVAGTAAAGKTSAASPLSAQLVVTAAATCRHHRQR